MDFKAKLENLSRNLAKTYFGDEKDMERAANLAEDVGYWAYNYCKQEPVEKSAYDELRDKLARVKKALSIAKEKPRSAEAVRVIIQAYDELEGEL